MLNQLKQQLQQTLNPFKITVQGEQSVRSPLSANEIALYLERIFNQEGLINIDEQDFSILNRMAEIQVRMLECDLEQLNTALPLLFEGITAADCIVAHTNTPSEFSLENHNLIMQEMEKSVTEEATIIFGCDVGIEKVQLLVLFGFDYTDEKWVQLFIEELKQNPQLSIAALQRKYSLDFARAARNLKIAKQHL